MTIHSKLMGLASMLILLLTFACTGGSSSEDSTNTVEEDTTTTTEENTEEPRTILYVTHQVKDYDVWKPGFDDHESARLESGIHKIGVANDQADNNIIHLAFNIDDLAFWQYHGCLYWVSVKVDSGGRNCIYV